MRLPALFALLLVSISASAADAPLNDKQQVLWARLRTAVADVEQRLDGVLGVAILDLNSGQQLLIRPDEVFPQASSIKIAVLAERVRSYVAPVNVTPPEAPKGLVQLKRKSSDGTVVPAVAR